MINVLKYSKIWLSISALSVILGAVFLIAFGLKLGIDFRGGTLIELNFENPVDTNLVKQIVSEQGIINFQIQTAENNGIIIKTQNLEKEKVDEIESSLRNRVGAFKETRLESIGPVVGQKLKKNAIIELILVCTGIILYIAYAFRKVPKPVTPWRFGWAAILALFHDLIFVLGIFALLGKFMGIEIDSMFVTALLTVLGFSVHDTIVVFDRIRENLRVHSGQNLEFVINHSIAQTLVRSFNTSLTVLFVLLAMLLFGGESIRYFVLTLFLGIMVGTYSSVFVASPILIIWQRLKMPK